VYAVDYESSVSFDDVSFSTSFGTVSTPTTTYSPGVSTTSIASLGNLSYTFSAPVTVDNLGVMSAGPGVSEGAVYGIAHTSYKNSPVHSSLVGITLNSFRGIGFYGMAYEHGEIPETPEVQQAISSGQVSVVTHTDAASGRQIDTLIPTGYGVSSQVGSMFQLQPVGSSTNTEGSFQSDYMTVATVNGTEYVVNNATLQSLGYINEELGKQRQGDQNYTNSAGPNSFDTDEPLTYRIDPTFAANDDNVVRILLTPQTPVIPWNYYNGAYFRLGDNVVSTGSISGLGVDAPNRANNYKPNNWGDMLLQINIQGNISPIKNTRIIVPDGVITHEILGIFHTIAKTPLNTLIAQDIVEIIGPGEIVWNYFVKEATQDTLGQARGIKKQAIKISGVEETVSIIRSVAEGSRTNLRIIDNSTGQVIAIYNTAGILKVEDDNSVTHELTSYMPYRESIYPALIKTITTLKKSGVPFYFGEKNIFHMLGGLGGTYGKLDDNGIPMMTLTPQGLYDNSFFHEIIHLINDQIIASSQETKNNETQSVLLSFLSLFGANITQQTPMTKKEAAIDTANRQEIPYTELYNGLINSLSEEGQVLLEKIYQYFHTDYISSKNYYQEILGEDSEYVEKNVRLSTIDEIFAHSTEVLYTQGIRPNGTYSDGFKNLITLLSNEPQAVEYIRRVYNNYVDFPKNSGFQKVELTSSNNTYNNDNFFNNSTQGDIYTQVNINGERWLLVNFNNLNFSNEGKARFFDTGAVYNLPYASKENWIPLQRLIFETPNTVTTLPKATDLETGSLAPLSLNGVKADYTALGKGALGEIIRTSQGNIYRVLFIEPTVAFKPYPIDLNNVNSFFDVKRLCALDLGKIYADTDKDSSFSGYSKTLHFIHEESINPEKIDVPSMINNYTTSWQMVLTNQSSTGENYANNFNALPEQNQSFTPYLLYRLTANKEELPNLPTEISDYFLRETNQNQKVFNIIHEWPVVIGRDRMALKSMEVNYSSFSPNSATNNFNSSMQWSLDWWPSSTNYSYAGYEIEKASYRSLTR